MPLTAMRHRAELILAVDLPGVASSDIDVIVDGNVLEIKALRGAPTYEGAEPFLDERLHGELRRRLLLAPGLDADRLNFELENGVLIVRIPVGTTEAPPGYGLVDEVQALVEESAADSVVLFDTLIESAEAQVGLLQELKRAAGESRRETVSLTTPTGVVEYTLPLSHDETYGSTEVGEILSPTEKAHRSTAQNRRQSHELLGVKISNKYRYPMFQIDPLRREIIPVVKYANSRLQCDDDPWGTLDWWYSEDEALDDLRPVDLVKSGELTAELVDFAIDSGRQGME
jgi:hypothetical protein